MTLAVMSVNVEVSAPNIVQCETIEKVLNPVVNWIWKA
jgi:hypothetical protein